ncbi:MAG: tRNA pseudouridine(55) synthase TruB [Acidobacteriota bacterium]
MPAGFLVVDKPEGVTSHDVVDFVRRHFRLRKVGHLGTLDPMATGVLPLALGSATRLVRYLGQSVKSYIGEIRLGYSTDTYDRTGVPSTPPVVPSVSADQLDRLAAFFHGTQSQVPPPFSAKKVEGVRSYQLARRGIQAALRPVTVQIHSIRLRLQAADLVEFELTCSPGTYVRSIAHKLGQQLSCGAHLHQLRRVAAGRFSESEAVDLEFLRRLDQSRLGSLILPMEAALDHLPSVTIDGETETLIKSGRDFSWSGPPLEAGSVVRILSRLEKLIGLAEAVAGDLRQPAGCRFHPFLVLSDPK